MKVKHRAAITDPVKIGELLRAINGYTGGPVVGAALKLAPLLFARPGELRRRPATVSGQWRQLGSTKWAGMWTPLNASYTGLANSAKSMLGKAAGRSPRHITFHN